MTLGIMNTLAPKTPTTINNTFQNAFADGNQNNFDFTNNLMTNPTANNQWLFGNQQPENPLAMAQQGGQDINSLVANIIKMALGPLLGMNPDQMAGKQPATAMGPQTMPTAPVNQQPQGTNKVPQQAQPPQMNQPSNLHIQNNQDGSKSALLNQPNLNMAMTMNPDGRFAFAGTGQLPQGEASSEGTDKNSIRSLSQDQLKERYSNMDKDEMKKDMKNLSPDQIQKLWKTTKDPNVKSASGDDIHRRQAEKKDDKTEDGKTVHDPYEVNIGNEKFMFVRDKNKNGSFDGKQEIMGINDTKDNQFAEMKSIDKDKDGTVSKKEMEESGVKLLKVGDDGKLTNKEYSLNNVDGLNLKSFKETGNTAKTGTMGTFDLKLADGTTAKGKETFEDENYFKNLLAKGPLTLAS